MDLFHDSRQARYRSPFGAAEAGSTITLTLDAQLPSGSRRSCAFGKPRSVFCLWNAVRADFPSL